jgi:hypothetical protein
MRATHPSRSARFSRLSEPAWASTICRLSASPIPVPWGCGEERDEQVRSAGDARPLICYPDLQAPVARVPPYRHAAARLCGRVHRVLHQVDQDLVELVLLRFDGQRRSGPQRHVLPRLQYPAVPSNGRPMPDGARRITLMTTHRRVEAP